MALLNGCPPQVHALWSGLSRTCCAEGTLGYDGGCFSCYSSLSLPRIPNREYLFLEAVYTPTTHDPLKGRISHLKGVSAHASRQGPPALARTPG